MELLRTMARIISIHSLRVEGDHAMEKGDYPQSISIHSLRVEGDADVYAEIMGAKKFQSTPSVWRETQTAA